MAGDAAGIRRYHTRAVKALSVASETLSGHHGSQVPLAVVSACTMGGKGKGKGKETADAKTARLATEIDSCYAHANYLESLQSRHWTKGEPKGGKSSGKGGKKQGKGKETAGRAGSIPKRSAADESSKRRKNARSKSRDRQRSPSRNRSPSRGRKASRSKSQVRSRSSSSKRSSSCRRSDSTDFHDSAAAKKKAKQADKKRQKEQLKDGQKRETRLCVNCYFDGTYASSAKCFQCKRVFSSPCSPAESAAPTPVVLTTPVGTQAMGTLKQLGKAVSRVATFAEVTAKSQSNSSSSSPAVQPSAPVEVSVDPAAANTAVDAKQLTELRAAREVADAQRLQFLSVPTVVTALTAHVADLDSQISRILDARQSALAPHQLGQLVGQRQLEQSAALRTVEVAEQAHSSRLKEFDDYSTKIDNDFAEKLEALQAAKAAAATGLASERAELEKVQKATLANAFSALEQANALLKHAQGAVAAQGPAPMTDASPAIENFTNVKIIPMLALPTPVEIPDEKMEAYALTHLVLQHHTLQDADFPLAFSNLAFDHNTVAKLVGSAIWTAAYPDGAPKPADFIKRRVLGGLKVALNATSISQAALGKVDADAVTSVISKAGESFDEWRKAQSSSLGAVPY